MWCLCVALLLSLAAAASPGEVAALIDLFVSTTGAAWTEAVGWVADPVVADPCSAPVWTGVVCEGAAVV